MRALPAAVRRTVALLAAAWCGCAGTVPGAGPRDAAELPAIRLVAARAAADASPANAALQARAGWLEYLIASDPAAAEKRFAAAAALADSSVAAAPASTEKTSAERNSSSTRALALAGLGEVREDRLDTAGAVGAWAAALSAAPQDPLADLCALRLLDAEGESAAVDDLVLEAAARADLGMQPRAARLLREAAARIWAGRDVALIEQGKAGAREPQIWAAAGAIRRWRVAGPFAAHRLLDLGTPLALDGPAFARAPAQGPAGPTAERTLEFPDGDVGLDLEPGEGDLYYAASQLSAARGGPYLAWIEGAAALELRIDGAVVLSRSPWPRDLPRAQAVPVALGPGKHSLLVRWSRAEGARFRLLLARGDGLPSDLTSTAPAELSGARLQSACALGQTCVAQPGWDDRGGMRGEAERLLEADPRDALAAWLLARMTMGDDRAAARAATDRALSLSGGGAPALALHAQLVLRDPEVPDRLGRARALADLGDATLKDPQLLRARLTAAALQRDSERTDDAARELDRAEATAGKVVPPRLLLARARLLEAQGNLSGARARVASALAADPDRCDARQLAFELSRREGGLAEQLKRAEALLPCTESRGGLLALLRERGELARAERLLAITSGARPAQPGRLEQLADVQAAQKRVAEAVSTLRAAAALAPRSPEPLRRIAGQLDGIGDKAGAREARAAALARGPGDLSLRRQIWFDRGERILSWADRDGRAIARATTPIEAQGGAGKDRPAAVRLLDHGAVQLFEDGGGVERVHTVARVLDKKGISRFGEAQIPADAEVLELRTLKADGRVLEPESIPEKEGISLPGLEPGDSIEIDYLHGFASRGPELPGLVPGAFFFRDDEIPMAESTYEVRAPAALGLDVDMHNLRAMPLRQDGGEVRWSHSVRDSTPLEPEPNAPGEAEFAPWVQVGTGAGQRETVASMGDWVPLRARPGAASDGLAQAAGGSSPRERAERIFALVGQSVRGRANTSDFSTSAAHVLAQGRGNRIFALKATFASAGLRSHLAMVRTFGADPVPYRFPRGDLYTYAVLRLDLPEGPVWVDGTYRLGPFGALPVFAQGQEAWIVPEPGEQPEKTLTPSESGTRQDGRSVALALTLDKEGAASGTGRDEHRGFEAAALKDALERLDSDQRQQAVEAMLGRGMRGVTLESLSTENDAAQGGTASLLYALRVRLGRREGAALLLPASLLPARLSRHWVQKAERNLTLLVDATEQLEVRAVLALPPGLHLATPPAPVELKTRFGQYRWEAREEAGKLLLQETFALPQQRVTPADYAGFVQFARSVDLAQEQELRLGP